MDTIHCTTPKGVRLSRDQLSALISMPEQQFQEWCLMMERIRFMAARNRKGQVDRAYGVTA